ncbi:MAG: hypothetical protein FJ110_03135 [Deltaproteobacteria bacterium]|nr:hypothetical protein [Deltaproteobacteria bacterium]
MVIFPGSMGLGPGVGTGGTGPGGIGPGGVGSGPGGASLIMHSGKRIKPESRSISSDDTALPNIASLSFTKYFPASSRTLLFKA